MISFTACCNEITYNIKHVREKRKKKEENKRKREREREKEGERAKGGHMFIDEWVYSEGDDIQLIVGNKRGLHA